MPTKEVAKLLGTSYTTLYNLVRLEKIPEPPRFGRVEFFWRPENIEQARRALEAMKKTPKNQPAA